MTDNPNELTVENSAVVLIDHQPWVAFAIESIDRSVLINNVSEWAPDYTSPERSLVNDVVLQHGGGVGLALEYMLAQLTAGIVPAPTWVTEPEPAR